MIDVNESSLADWTKRGMTLLELSRLAFEVALEGLPRFAPCQIRLNGMVAIFDSAEHIERLEREIADAFFVRVRGLSEALLKELGTMDWRSGTHTVAAIEKAIGRRLQLAPDDLKQLTKLPKLRNIIAHADGSVDRQAKKVMPELIGPDVWMRAADVRNWYSLIARLIMAIGEPATAASL